MLKEWGPAKATPADGAPQQKATAAQGAGAGVLVDNHQPGWEPSSLVWISRARIERLHPATAALLRSVLKHRSLGADPDFGSHVRRLLGVDAAATLVLLARPVDVDAAEARRGKCRVGQDVPIASGETPRDLL